MAPKKIYRKRKIVKRRFPRKGNKSTFAKRVMKVVNRTAETKLIRFNVDKQIGTYINTNWGLDAIQPLTPYSTIGATISLGNSSSGRIGNKIRTKYLTLKGIMTPVPYNATANPNPTPLDVMMVIFSRRADSKLFAAGLSNFFQNGNSSSAPTGLITDTILDINKDVYQVYYKRIFKVGYSDFAGTGSSAPAQNFANNDYKYSCRFNLNLTKYCPKIIKFNDTDNDPYSRLLYCAFLPMRPDGNGVSVTATPLRYAMNWEYGYTDI